MNHTNFRRRLLHVERLNGGERDVAARRRYNRLRTLRGGEGCLGGREVIGRGDNGAVFAADREILQLVNAAVDPARVVVKQEKVRDEAHLQAIQQEVRIASRLGQAGLAPVVHGFMTRKCGRNVFAMTVVDRFAQTWEQMYPHGDDCQSAPYKIDEAHERALLQAIIAMVDLGIVHNDLHTGNIGFTDDGRVLLFDFGYAREIAPPASPEREQIILAHLYQVLEHYAPGTRDCSLLYEAVYHIRQGHALPDHRAVSSIDQNEC